MLVYFRCEYIPEVDAQPSPARLEEDATGTIESYTIGYAKGVPARAVVIARTDTLRFEGIDEAPSPCLDAGAVLGRFSSARAARGRAVAVVSHQRHARER